MPVPRTYQRATDGRFGSTAGMHTRKAATPKGRKPAAAKPAGGIAGAAAALLAGGPGAAGGVAGYAAKANALKAASGRAKAKGSSGSFDASKHPRGSDGRFISKAKVEEMKAAGNWPPVPVTKPTRKTPVRPKPVEEKPAEAAPAAAEKPTQPAAAPVPQKAYAGASDEAVALTQKMLEIDRTAGQELRQARDDVKASRAKMTELEYRVDTAANAKDRERLAKEKAAHWQQHLGLLERRAQLERDAPRQAREALMVSEPSSVKWSAASSDDKSTSAEEGLAFVAGVTGRGTALDGESVTLRQGFVSRAHASQYGEAPMVTLPISVSAGTTAHEIAHKIEHYDAATHEACVAFREKRRAESGESYTSLNALKTARSGVECSQHGEGEVGFEDKFFSPYCGRRYPDEMRSTEILSMGVERLHDDPTGFARDDPEYFQLTVTLLRRKV